MSYQLDRIGKRSIIVTPTMEIMRESIERHLPRGAMMAWVGDPGTGKTTTARWLASGVTLGSAFATGHYFNAPPMPSAGMGSLALRLLESLLSDLTGSAPRRVGRGQPLVSTVVQEILAALSYKNVSVLCIDEAGTLHPDALDGLMYIQDEAEWREQEFVCILIGMAGLPEHLRQNPRLDRRVKVRKKFTSLTWEAFPDFSRSLWQLDGIKRPAQAEEEAFISRLFKASEGNINAAVELMRSATYAAEIIGEPCPGLKALGAVVRLQKEDAAEVMVSSTSATPSRKANGGGQPRKPAVVAVGGEG